MTQHEVLLTKKKNSSTLPHLKSMIAWQKYLDDTAGTDVMSAELARVGPGEEESELDFGAEEAGLA